MGNSKKTPLSPLETSRRILAGEPADPPPLEKAKFSLVDFVMFAIGACTAIPLSDAGWSAVVSNSDPKRGITAITAGFILGVGAASFHWWKDRTTPYARVAALLLLPITISLMVSYFIWRPAIQHVIFEEPSKPPANTPKYIIDPRTAAVGKIAHWRAKLHDWKNVTEKSEDAWQEALKGTVQLTKPCPKASLPKYEAIEKIVCGRARRYQWEMPKRRYLDSLSMLQSEADKMFPKAQYRFREHTQQYKLFPERPVTGDSHILKQADKDEFRSLWDLHNHALTSEKNVQDRINATISRYQQQIDH